MTNPLNHAAFLPKALAQLLTVETSPFPVPGPGQLVIRNAALAINPIEVMIQDTDFVKLNYPVILGQDVAGEVMEIGEGVQGFEKGMRVMSRPLGWPTGDNAQGAFQEYTLAPAVVTVQIPNDMPFENAVVLPLAMSTAAAGLYQEDFLALDLLTLATAAESKNEAVVVWGGSSSVGGCAVQLLKHSGYEVFATTSHDNLSYVESLGATKIFDYKADNVVDQILRALDGRNLVGCYDAIGTPATTAHMVRIAQSAKAKKVVASTNPILAGPADGNVMIKGILAGSIAENSIGPALFHDYLEKALASKVILAKPDPIVVGKGLDKIQEAMDRLRAGVSAGKYVVTL